MFEWEQYFESHILDRGWSYAREGAVEHITKDSGRIEAVVEGTEYYRVMIDREGDSLNSTYCSCPYAAKGNNCKHMAAVLYALDAGDIIADNINRPRNTTGLEPSDSSATPKNSERLEWEEEDLPLPLDQLLEQASRQDLESVLLDLALEDVRMESHIRTRLSKNLITTNTGSLKWDIDNIFDTYTYRGYIDYHAAFDFACDLMHFLENVADQLLTQKKYLELFDLTIYAYVRLGNCSIDDDGEITQISKVCYEIWKKIISECPGEIRDRMKSSLL